MFALKSVKTLDGDLDHKAFKDELFALRELSHSNIATIVNVICHQGYRGIVMEYCEAGDLRDLIDHQLGSREWR